MTIALVATSAIGATQAYFVDTETSTGNTFAAGTLDLNVDGDNENVVKFTVSNMKPGSQSIGTWAVKNVGTVNGFLDLEGINLTQTGGTFTDPESEAGDTGNNGNLGDLLTVSLFVDVNGNGWFGVEDTAIYNGTLAGMASSNLNLPLAADASSNITLQVNWQNHSGTTDNLGQGDTAELDMTFELSQTPAQ